MTDTPACTCAHLDTDWHQPSCPLTGRRRPTADDLARLAAIASDTADVTRRAAALHAELGDRHGTEPRCICRLDMHACPAHPREQTSANECPPGVHSMFDPCPGNCTVPVVQLHNGGLAQDEDGLSLQAWDDQRRDYEVRLPGDEAAALAGHLIDATDPDALSLCPGGPVLHLHDAYLDGYRAAIIRVRQAVRHPGTHIDKDQT